MRVNQDDVTRSGKLTAPSSMRTTLTCLRPAVGEHVRTTGRTLDHEQAARAADSSESKWFGINWMGVRGYGGMAPCIATTFKPRPGVSFIRARTGIT
jgi:hypothetical protein